MIDWLKSILIALGAILGVVAFVFGGVWLTINGYGWWFIGSIIAFVFVLLVGWIHARLY